MQDTSPRRWRHIQPGGGSWGIGRGVCTLTLWCALVVAPVEALAQAEPQVSLTKSVYPAAVVAGGRVSYAITLTNSGRVAAEGLTVRDTLAAGFAYRSGSTRITVNGVQVSRADPTVSGRTLTWSGLRLPSGRSDTFYGIHTFVQRRAESDYIKHQLNRSLELMGSGAYVTQLFDWLDPSWQGPPNWMRDFVGWAYDRGLTPVVRLAGARGTYWIKPKPDPDGSYTTWAQTFKRVVEGLPRRDGHWLYVQIWNEPNLAEEWEGHADPAEYGRFLVAAAAAIRSLNDSRIVILNGPLSPGGEHYYLDYLDDMLTDVPAALWAFDVWASHPYPGNRPPDYNIHSGTAGDNWASIDLYQRELEVLARHGRGGVKVLLTETGYALGNAYDVLYPPITEGNRADYIQRAFRDYWSQWPEVIGVCPYELVDPEEQWWVWDWLWKDGRTHQQFDTVKAMNKTPAVVSSALIISFEATAPSAPGMYYNDISATAANATIPPATQVAPVQVNAPTATPTRTASPTTTQTPTTEPTWTPALTATDTVTPTTTLSATPSPTGSITATATLVTPSLTPTETTLPSPTPSPTPGCQDLIVNGGFEATEAWQTPNTPHPAGYTSAAARTGQRSMRIGIDSGDNVRSYSTAWQAFHVPATAPDPTLSFWYYPQSEDTTGDYQYVLIVDEAATIRDWVLFIRSDDRQWVQKQHSLADYRGMDMRVYFGVYNDGSGGVTAMYVDDVAAPICSSATPTTSPTTPPSPTPTATVLRTHTPTVTATPRPTITSRLTPTVTATPTLTPSNTPSPTDTATPIATPTTTPSASATLLPTDTPSSTPTSIIPTATATGVAPSLTPSPTVECAELIVDGGFEWDDDAWDIPIPGRADYSTAQARSGQRSMRVGIESGANVYSYSTVRQTFHIPADALDPVLSFWYYPVSGDTQNDLQYALIEDEDGVSRWVLRTQSNAQAWTYKEYSLVAWRGTDVTLYFGVLNDGSGGVTAMYVDDVAVPMCGPRPTASATPVTAVPRAYLPLVMRTYGESESLASPTVPEVAASQSLPSEARTIWAAGQSEAGPGFEQGIAFNPAQHLLYVGAGRAVLAVDQRTGAISAEISLEAAPRALAVDTEDNHLYAALHDANALVVIDGVRHVLLGKVSEIPGASGVAVGDDRVYVTATASDELVVIDPKNHAIIQRVAVGGAPYNVVFDPATNRIYVGNAGDDTVSVLDGPSAALLGTVQLGGLGHPHGLALDPIRGRLYVTYALTPKYRAVAAIDTFSGEIISQLFGDETRPLMGAYGISVDPLLGQVYVTTGEAVLTLSGRTLSVLRTTAGVGPAYAFGLCRDPLEERLYIVDAWSQRVAVTRD